MNQEDFEKIVKYQKLSMDLIMNSLRKSVPKGNVTMNYDLEIQNWYDTGVNDTETDRIMNADWQKERRRILDRHIVADLEQHGAEQITEDLVANDEMVQEQYRLEMLAANAL